MTDPAKHPEPAPSAAHVPFPSSSHDEEHDKPAAATAAADESASLLLGGDTSPPSRASKTLYTLTLLALLLASTAIIFVIISKIVLQFAPNYRWFPYDIESAIPAVCIVAGISIAFSVVNFQRLRHRRRPTPLWPNLLFDVIGGFNVIVYSVPGFSDVYSSYRGWLPSNVLAGVALGAAVLLGVVHILLFGVRCRLLSRAKFWKKPLHFPTGQFTVELSFKMSREQERRAQEQLI